MWDASPVSVHARSDTGGSASTSRFAQDREPARSAGGETVLVRRVDPGESVRFPYLQRRLQTVVIRQFTGAGRVRATIKATFARRTSGIYCFAYQSPRLEVHMTPRR